MLKENPRYYKVEKIKTNNAFAEINVDKSRQNELLLAREGDESTKYSQSPSADDRLHARFRNKSRKCVKNALKNTPETVCFLVELLTTRKGGEIACKKRRRPQATSAPHGCKPCISFHWKMK